MRRIKGKFIYHHGEGKLFRWLEPRDFRLMRAVVKEAENVDQCQGLARLQDALNAFNAQQKRGRK